MLCKISSLHNKSLTLIFGISQWHHNECNGVSNHQCLHCLLNHLFGCRPKKTIKLHVTGLCEGNSPVNFPHNGPVMLKMFPFDDVIMRSHICTWCWWLSARLHCVSNRVTVVLHNAIDVISNLCKMIFNGMSLTLLEIPGVKSVLQNSQYLVSHLYYGIILQKYYMRYLIWHIHVCIIVPADGSATTNTLRPGQNCHHFADNIFKCIFVNENIWISLQFLMKFVSTVRINNIPALV